MSALVGGIIALAIMFVIWRLLYITFTGMNNVLERSPYGYPFAAVFSAWVIWLLYRGTFTPKFVSLLFGFWVFFFFCIGYSHRPDLVPQVPSLPTFRIFPRTFRTSQQIRDEINAVTFELNPYQNDYIRDLQNELSDALQDEREKDSMLGL